MFAGLFRRNLRWYWFVLLVALGMPAYALAGEETADELETLLNDPKQAAPVMTDLLIQLLLEDRQKALLFVPPERYAADSAAQSELGRRLVADYQRNWEESLDALFNLLARRGLLSAALSSRGARLPMSMEMDSDNPLIAYVSALLNRRDLSPCEVERNRPAVCFANIFLRRDKDGGVALRDLKVLNAKGEPLTLPPYAKPALDFEQE